MFFYLAYTVCFLTLLLSSFVSADNALIAAADAPVACVSKPLPQNHFEKGLKAIDEGDFKQASVHMEAARNSLRNPEAAHEALFYLGVLNYSDGEFDLANEMFSKYLKVQGNPKNFEETMRYKLAIAEEFRKGSKKRIFGAKIMPKAVSGKETAFEIYEEIITAMPCHEIASYAIYGKATLLLEAKDYREAIDTFQMVLKRFPKHELSPFCYVSITKAYRDLIYHTWQNPDFLALAEGALARFSQDYPRDEMLAVAEKNVKEAKEIYARGLHEVGRLYERKGHPAAAYIYYHQAESQFPDSFGKKLSNDRIAKLNIDPEAFKIISEPKEEDSDSASLARGI